MFKFCARPSKGFSGLAMATLIKPERLAGGEIARGAEGLADQKQNIN
jgi:hypothetical protein